MFRSCDSYNTVDTYLLSALLFCFAIIIIVIIILAFAAFFYFCFVFLICDAFGLSGPL